MTPSPRRGRQAAVDPVPLLIGAWRALADALASTAAAPLDQVGWLPLVLDSAPELPVDLTRAAPPGTTAVRTLAEYLAVLPVAAEGPTGEHQPRDAAGRLVQAADALASAAAGPPVIETAVAGVAVERDVHLAAHLVAALAAGRQLPSPPDIERAAVRYIVRLLARALAERAPGHSVELRVPPHVAVQCVSGPRHTRGTPPNVVEIDPLPFLELATGVRGWDETYASGALRASGERADLRAWLPLVDPRQLAPISGRGDAGIESNDDTTGT